MIKSILSIYNGDFFKKEKEVKKLYKLEVKKDITAYELYLLFNPKLKINYVILDNSDLTDQQKAVIKKHLVEVNGS